MCPPQTTTTKPPPTAPTKTTTTNNNPTATQTTQSNEEGQSANSNGINRPKPSGTTSTSPISVSSSPPPTVDQPVNSSQPQIPLPTTTISESPIRPSVSSKPAASKQLFQPSQREICRIANHSAVVNGAVSVSSPPSEFADAFNKAQANWNKVGGPKINVAPKNSPPTVVIVGIHSDEKWQGRYTTGNQSQPARIEINLDATKNATPEQIQGLIAHELGHSLGLSDTTNPQSLMNATTGKSPTGPQFSDIKALHSLPDQISACRVAGITEYGFCWTGHVGDENSACNLSQYLHCPFGRAHNGSSDTACRMGNWDDNPKNLEMIAEIAADAAMVASMIASDGTASAAAIAARAAIKEAIKQAVKNKIEKGADDYASKEAAEEAAQAVAEAEAAIARQRMIDESISYNQSSQNLEHTFGSNTAKHKFQNVVRNAGSDEEAMRALVKKIYENPPSEGRFETIIDLFGENVTVRGYMSTEGIFKIGTAFIP